MFDVVQVMSRLVTIAKRLRM